VGEFSKAITPEEEYLGKIQYVPQGTTSKQASGKKKRKRKEKDTCKHY